MHPQMAQISSGIEELIQPIVPLFPMLFAYKFPTGGIQTSSNRILSRAGRPSGFWKNIPLKMLAHILAGKPINMAVNANLPEIGKS